MDLFKSSVICAGPVVALDRGLINVQTGPLISLASGSKLEVTGDPLKLFNGSRINVFNGPFRCSTTMECGWDGDIDATS